MNKQPESNASPDMLFTASHAEELRAMLEAERLHVPNFSEKPLPGYEHSPRSLESIELDERFQAAADAFEPLRTEAATLDKQLAGYMAERNAGGVGNLTHQELAANKARRAELAVLIRQRLEEQVAPILRERLADAARLPIYTGSLDASSEGLDSLPAAAMAERIQYGACNVDVDRIILTPSNSNWGGVGDSKAEGESSDLIVGSALQMLAGEYDESRTVGLPSVLVVADRTGNYVYGCDNGTHRVSAAKLLGRRTIVVQARSYNYVAGDAWAEGIDGEQRARQRR